MNAPSVQWGDVREGFASVRRGRYDAGWTDIREARYRRQIELERNLRKLDYQYPNQRAKVSVRPAGSDEPS